MIRILAGDNYYLIKQQVAKIATDFGADIKTFYGDEKANLIDQIMAQDLFSQKQVIVIKNLFSNKQLTEQILDNFELIKNDQLLELVIIETKLDKRLKLTKLAQKQNLVSEFNNPKSYDKAGAIKNINLLADKVGKKIEPKAAQAIWQLVGVDMNSQKMAIDKLALLPGESISLDQVEQYIMPSLKVDSFIVIDQLMAGQKDKLEQSINKLEQTSVVAPVFWGLATSQLINLVIIASLSELNPKDFKIHPFVANKLKSSANRLSSKDIQNIVNILDQTDYKLKTTAINQWLLIKIALLKICQIFA